MSLIINIKHLETDSKEYEGSIPLDDLDMDPQDELIRPNSALSYHLNAELQGKNVLVQGQASLSFHFECARCLAPFERNIELNSWSHLLALSGPEAVPIDNDCIDLTPYLREDMLLSLPQHPLCAKDCRGINHSAENTADPRSVPPETQPKSSAWSALDELHLE